MISCTDFIPAYSELFSYLEDKNGKKEGIGGCFAYWAGTLNEEAADFTMYLSEQRGFSCAACTTVLPRAACSSSKVSIYVQGCPQRFTDPSFIILVSFIHLFI